MLLNETPHENSLRTPLAVPAKLEACIYIKMELIRG